METTEKENCMDINFDFFDTDIHSYQLGILGVIGSGYQTISLSTFIIFNEQYFSELRLQKQ